MQRTTFTRVTKLKNQKSRVRLYHLHHLHLRLDAEVVQECCQVLLHLDGVVLHLGNCEDSHATLLPYLSEDREQTLQLHKSINSRVIILLPFVAAC